jgi:hypothetical protein
MELIASEKPPKGAPPAYFLFEKEQPAISDRQISE